MDAFEKIAQQQKGKEKTPVFYVGEQLKDIIKDNPTAKTMVSQDLDRKDMSIEKCEAEIRAYAKKNGGCTPPDAAEKIIREFYGISNSSGGGRIDLADFFG